MRGREIVKSVGERRTGEHRFVRWWRNEEDFLDYDLIDRFLANASDGEEIGGIDLLTMDDMWRVVQSVGGKRIRRFHDEGGDTVEWVHQGHTDRCRLSPEVLMDIFDTETGGNPVDS